MIHSFTQMASTRALEELVLDHDKRSELLNEAKASLPPPKDTDDAAVRQEALSRALSAIYQPIYEKTHADVAACWPFESEIRRPYFHPKPLDPRQLANWRAYLDFVQQPENFDQLRIRTLFERCLVACASYEEFWERYVRWLEGIGDEAFARAALERACLVHLPPTKVKLQLLWAAFEERHGQPQRAKYVFDQLRSNLPAHGESIVRYADFERRQDSENGAMIAEGILHASSIDDNIPSETRAMLAVHRAFLISNHLHDLEKARNVFNDTISQFPMSKFAWLSWIRFEESCLYLAPLMEPSLARLDQIIRRLLSQEGVPKWFARDCAERHLSFLYSNDLDLARASELERLLTAPLGSLSDAEAISVEAFRGKRKRDIEDATEAEGKSPKTSRLASSGTSRPPWEANEQSELATNGH